MKQLPNAENGSFQRQYIDRMEAPDARTVIYHLSQPSAYLFSQIQFGNGTAQPIIPKEMLANLGTQPQIGSGPYQLADHTFGVRYLWKRFDKYRERQDGGPYIDEREVLMLTDQVAIEVHDSGPGLSPEAKATLFEPTITFKKHGMGLGLSIARSHALLSGGDITVVPGELGGAAFRVTLPAVAAPPREEAIA